MPRMRGFTGRLAMLWTMVDGEGHVACHGIFPPSATGVRPMTRTDDDEGTATAREDENARLKKVLAGQMLDMAAMKELLSKKW